MNCKNDLIANFSSHLFWDTNRELLDTETHKSYIIKQILEYGYFEDWKRLNQIYAIEEIKEAVINFRTLDKKALSFIACVTNTPIQEFRCYTSKQSNQKHWIY